MEWHRATIARNTAKTVLTLCLFLAATSASAATPNFQTDHRLYDQGADILALQQFLNANGFIVAQSGPGSSGNETSFFGMATLQALKAFQTAHGLPSTGFFGPLSRAAINSGEVASSTAGQTTAPNTTATLPVGTVFTEALIEGQSGPDITALQNILIQQGFLGAGNDTGYFGSLTAKAVAAFQTAHGIEALGGVGPLTRAVLNSLLPTPTSLQNSPSTSSTTTTQSFPPPLPGYAPGQIILGGGGSSGGGGGGSSSADTTAPSVPTNLSAVVASSTEVDLSWTASTDNVAIANYKVFRNSVLIASPATTTYANSGLTPGTSYSYTVVAVDTSNNSSAQSAAVATSTIALPAISSISSGTPGQTSATISWSTDRLTNSKVVYGLTSAYGSATSSATLVASHSIGVTGLTASTLYHYAVVSSDVSGNTATSTDQTFTTASGLADGFSGAQTHGTIVNSHLADTGTVVAVNVVGGSGYTNGTGYAWTSAGGGCSSNANGTIDVVGGALTNPIISSAGSGCTSRPTITIPAGAGSGTGGTLVPSVYQLTPHNATTPFNLPGIDYLVGYDTTLTLNDPTVSANLPACASVSAGVVTINSSNCTINGFDFGGHNATLVIAGGLNNVVVSNNHFLDDNTHVGSVTLGSGTCGATFQYNEFDGGAFLGTTIGHNSIANLASSCSSGTITYEYNYCHNAYYKCINYGGVPAATTTLTAIEKYNVFRDISLGSVNYSHGESEYAFSGTTKETLAFTDEFNLYWDEWNAGATTTTSQTATLAAEADAVSFSSAVVDHNLVLGQGPWAVTGSDNSSHLLLTGSAAIYGGHQEGGILSGGSMTNNYIDYSGKFFPYNQSSGTLLGDFPGLSGFNAATGNSCTTSSCN